MKPVLIFTLWMFSASALLAARPDPQTQIDNFFAALGSKDGSAAIDSLCKGTVLEAQKGQQLPAFSPPLDGALKMYGKIIRVENVDKKLFGESFVRFRCISYHASGPPLFWEFMFFRAKDEWPVHVFKFNDEFAKVFDAP